MGFSVRSVAVSSWEGLIREHGGGVPLTPLPSVLLGLNPSLDAASPGAGAQGSLRWEWGPGPGLGASFLAVVGGRGRVSGCQASTRSVASCLPQVWV